MSTSSERPSGPPPPPANPRLWKEKVDELRAAAGPVVGRVIGPITFRLGVTLTDHPAIILRDSLLFRAGSLGYHVDLLRRQFHAYFARAHAPQAILGSQDILYSARQDITYLTDDVLFNSISLLDYVGNFVGFALTKNRSTWKWNGIVKAGRDPRNPLSVKAAVALAVSYDQWIDKLQEVRSTIIHERVVLGDDNQSIRYEIRDGHLVPTEFLFPMPAFVLGRLKFLTPHAGKTQVELVHGTEQIALASLDATLDVIRALHRDVGLAHADGDDRQQTE
jgi:hypothetical protein